MASRKRSPRPVDSKRKRRKSHAAVENLEGRLLLSQANPSLPIGPYLVPAEPNGPSTAVVPGTPSPEGHQAYHALPLFQRVHPSPLRPKHGVPLQGTGPMSGLTPRQLAGAYGANNIFFGTIQGTGAGQTIAVIDAGDNPDFKPTGPAFKGSALQVFDSFFNLPDPPSFQKFNFKGGSTLPAPISAWSTEIALDVEWAHAIAPDAKIDLVEASNSSFTELMQGAKTAATTLGASVVSMSFGMNFDVFGPSGTAYEQFLDDTYLKPALAANPGVTFLASSGDTGANTSAYGFLAGPLYPSVSPNVVAVGGTTLDVEGTTRVSEVGWSYGSDSLAPSNASGGGYSQVFTLPSYQENDGFSGNNGYRTTPDVSSDADPNTGVSVYDPYDFGAATPWEVVGGTSLASPTWAGLIAIADQGHELLTGTTLNGPNETLPALYAFRNYSKYFYDITSGYNFYSAGPGYDLVTGIGTPRANNLIPALASVGIATGFEVYTQPPTDVIQNGYFGTIGAVVNGSGAVDVTFNGSATISLVSGPNVGSFTKFTVPIVNGLAVFDQMQLPVVSTSTGNVFELSTTVGTSTFTVDTNAVLVNQAATQDVGVYYPLPIDSSLRGDITLADSNADPTNDVYLVYSTPFDLTGGQVAIANASTLPSKSLSIIGQAQDNSIITTGSTSRIFSISGTNGASPSMTVVFQDLSLEGGYATDAGGLLIGGNPSLGGALIINGGVVTLESVALSDNEAVAADGAAGSNAFGGGASGGPGVAGHSAFGGAIYLAAGSLTLDSDTINGNRAIGGKGGDGGDGGGAVTFTSLGGIRLLPITGGHGGEGAKGGSAQGGALYVAGGTLTITGGTAEQHAAVGADGGKGGDGGFGCAGKPGGTGGTGGHGGRGAGAILYLAGGKVSVTSAALGTTSAGGSAANSARGGKGGDGGTGGIAGSATFPVPGAGGQGGDGGSGFGGGIYLNGGSLTFSSATVSNDLAGGGTGGGGGAAGPDHAAAARTADHPQADPAGPAGTGSGGGIYVAGSLTLAGVSIENNTATNGGGVFNAGALTINDISISDNTATDGGGGGLYNDGKVTFNGAIFSGNTASGDGGGLYNALALAVQSATFSNNTAGDGGAIYSAGALSVTSSTFTNNSATSPLTPLGGGIYATSTLSVTNTTFTGNSALDGGAIEVTGSGVLSASADSFTQNSATDGGGISVSGSATITDVTFTGNTASSQGGAIEVDRGTLTASECTFAGNTSGTSSTTGFGGAIRNFVGTATVSYSSFSNNIAESGYGGAIQNEGTFDLTYLSFQGNSASDGGAIAGGGTFVGLDFTASGNSAQEGGAIYNQGTMTLTNATLANNSASSAGGGIENLSTLTAINTTIAYNNVTTTGGGGGVDAAAGTTALYNTIVDLNTDPSGQDDVIGTVSGSFNLISVANPQLGLLANNGGPIETIALLAGSPAIDAGSATIPGITVPTTDARGALRGPAGLNAGSTVDIGAYEASSSFLVTSTADSLAAGTLRTAVAWANTSFNDNPENHANPAPNTIVFDTTHAFLTPQTITLSLGALTFTNTSVGVAVAGPGPSTVTISGDNASQVFSIDSGVTATIAGVTITQGTGYEGGGVDNEGTLTVSNDSISGNSATYGGGIAGYGPLTVEGVSFTGNSAGEGGAIEMYAGTTATVSSSTFTSNSASVGGGIFAIGTLDISGSTFTGNSASVLGGGVAIQGSSDSSVTSSTFSQNTAASGGAIANAATLTASDLTVTGNSATQSGGGVFNGGILALSASTITGNSAVDDGGGVANSGSLTASTTTFSGNSAATGGGVYNPSTGIAAVSSDALSGNTATGAGGAVENLGALDLANTTIAGNSAATGGGVDNPGTLTAVNVTLAYNSATSAGGGGGLNAGPSASATINNTIVALNTDPSGPDDIAGTVSGSYNLIGTGGSGGLTNSNGNTVGVSTPGLGPLANNGGPTQTIELEAGSPAIDAGSNALAVDPSTGLPLLTDQRGALRGGVSPLALNAGKTVDIGAFEASSSYLVTSTADTTTIGTLRTAVAWANGSTNFNPANIAAPAPNTILFDTANVFSTPRTITLQNGTLALTGTSVAEAITGPGASVLTISGNGAVGVFSVASGVTASVSGVTISGGLSGANGGGFDNSGTLTVEDVTFSGNAAASGGAIANEPGGTLVVTDSSFANNVATSGGGAIDNTGTATVTDSALQGNAANLGGAIFNNAELVVSGGQISGNSATGAGGGVENSGNMTITYATLSGNSTSGLAAGGGGIDNSGLLKISSSTLANNSATGNGGAILDESAGTLSIVNSTLALNQAINGGAIDESGTLTLLNCTLADNTVLAGSGGGLNLEVGSKATMYNTIVASNVVLHGQSPLPDDIEGFVAAGSLDNLIGTGGAGGLLGGVNGNQVGVANPLLGPLANNGGPTETIALLKGSPAIDAGTNTISGVTIPKLDQRGALRGPLGLNAGSTDDIGAYEASSSFLVTSVLDALDAGTLRTAVGWANVSSNANPANLANPAPNTIVFDSTGVFATPQTITLQSGPLVLSNTVTAEAVSGLGPKQVDVSGNGAVGVFQVQSGVTASLTGLTISGGFATAGGGVANLGQLTVTNTTIAGNSAATGGGIANEMGATLSIFDTTLSDNSATTGGAIDNFGTLVATNATLAGNSATSGGAVASSGPLTFVNLTIAYNNVVSGGSGGGLDVTGGTATLDNTIIALNTAGTGSSATASDIAGTVASKSSYNLIGTGGAGGLTNGVNGNQVGVTSPGLAPAPGLGNNGGATQTIALEPGSPALDAGSAQISGVVVPTTDQRGALRNPARNVGATTIDIGAFEASSTYLVTSAADNFNSGTLRAAIDWANINPSSAVSPGPNTIVFDTSGVFATPQTITLSPTLGTLAFDDTSTPEVVDGPGASSLTISGNGAVGVFSVLAGVTVTLEGLSINSGAAASGAGIENAGTLSVANSSMEFDIATYYGGAIDNNGGRLTITDSVFSNDQAPYGLGGAIDNNGTLSISGSTFSDDLAFQGGAIDNKSGSLSVTNSTFANNNSATEGGAIFSNAAASVTGTTIANNVAFDGGAIANDLAGSLTLTNSTIADNSAGENGGGIDSVGTLLAINSTIAFNTVASGGSGGGFYTSAGNATLYNTIVAENTSGTGKSATANDISGTVSTSSSYNLIGAGGGLANGVNNNIIGAASPDLGTLANNGGPTETIALLSGSPAIDGGSASIAGVTVPVLDQRGALRGPAGLNAGSNPDIGAYEASSSYLVTSTADSTDPGTLRAAVGWANASSNANPAETSHPVANTIVFDATGDFAVPQTITLSSGPLIFSNTSTPVSIQGPTASLTISGNDAFGVFRVAKGVTASFDGLTITDGVANAIGGTSGLGGGIDNFGNLTVTASTIAGNTAIDGGGIANEVGGSLTIVDSTLAGNSGTSGGGLYNAGSLTVTNSTVANNSAFQGGALYNAGVFSAVNATLADNSVIGGGTGGGVDATLGTIALYNSIVALNTEGTGSGALASDIAGNVSSASAYNVIGTGGSGGLSNGVNGNKVGVANPLLGTLANNGGPTLTISLLPGSPALGAGSSSIPGITVPVTDQRGVSRPSTAIDIGAYQLTQQPVTPSSQVSVTVPVSVPLSSAPAPVATVSVPTATAPVAAHTVTAKSAPNGRAALKLHRTSKLSTANRHTMVASKHSTGNRVRH